MSTDDDRRVSEAREILKRVEADNASFLTGSLEDARERTASHFAARDADDGDRMALWATRLGRSLGLVFFVILIINLFTGWFF